MNDFEERQVACQNLAESIGRKYKLELKTKQEDLGGKYPLITYALISESSVGFDIALNWLGDSVHLQIGSFCAELFPRETAVDKAEAMLNAWLSGKARIRCFKKKWHFVEKKLFETHTNDIWKCTYDYSHFVFTFWRAKAQKTFRHDKGTIANMEI